MFDDRADAARQLAGRLAHLRGRHPLILAVPRGAVPMGVILAQALDGDLDLVLVRKLGAPGNPEYAIGAVDEAGHVSLNPDTQARVDAAYLAAEAAARAGSGTPPGAVRNGAGRCGRAHRGGGGRRGRHRCHVAGGAGRAAPEPTGAADAAVGVAPPQAIARLQAHADKVVCLQVASDFQARSDSSTPTSDRLETIRSSALLADWRAQTARRAAQGRRP